ncbi:hypothetical protein CEXT_469471 [Caerostris extrusa]|uniref:Uncharacterized protein n=1 Tax=Caerostris extrusa TaxID=172846 RepID=A0AAV4PCR8_CAEEX|nr:hypothetical protein CEXT_469471 [Caerostris extrusa]
MGTVQLRRGGTATKDLFYADNRVFSSTELSLSEFCCIPSRLSQFVPFIKCSISNLLNLNKVARVVLHTLLGEQLVKDNYVCGWTFC